MNTAANIIIRQIDAEDSSFWEEDTFDTAAGRREWLMDIALHAAEGLTTDEGEITAIVAETWPLVEGQLARIKVLNREAVAAWEASQA